MSNKTRRIDLIRSPNVRFEPGGPEWQPLRLEGRDQVEGWRTPTSGFMRLTFEGSEIYLAAHYRLARGREDGVPAINCEVDVQLLASRYGVARDYSASWNGPDATASQGAHNFSINVAFPIGIGEDPESEVILDTFHYLPSASTSEFLTQGATVVYDNSDPHIHYTGTWDTLRDDDGEAVSVTAREGSSMSVIFIGSTVTWFGWLPAGDVPGRSRATYWIDSGAPVEVSWEKPRLEATQRGFQLFSAAGLAQRAHNLTIIYQGSDSGLPLVLDYLLVAGGEYRIEPEPPTLPPQTSSDDAVPSDAFSSPSPTTNSSRTGAIVGGVVGGLAAIVLVALVLLWMRQRRSRRNLTHATEHAPISFSQPVTFPPSSYYRTGNGATSAIETEPSSLTSYAPIGPDSLSPPTSLSSDHTFSVHATYRKGAEALLSSRSEDGSPRQHQDSGVRLIPNRRSSLPPVYTAN